MAHYKATEELRPDAVRQNRDSLPTQLHGTELSGYCCGQTPKDKIVTRLKKPRGKVTDNTNELLKASSANHNTSPMVGKGLASASPFFYAQVDPPGWGSGEKKEETSKHQHRGKTPSGRYTFFAHGAGQGEARSKKEETSKQIDPIN
tara:strand:+ start:114 stop:554 length:441 start_codon:yes stop_codon:yes gene_type:complete